MSRLNYTALVMQTWSTLVTFSVIGLLLGIGFSFLFPLKYSSTVRMLIIQDIGTADAYTASRSAERIADNLATIVYTTSFYDKVTAAGFRIDPAYFPADEIKKRRLWEKTVSATVSRDSGLLTIAVYHPDVSQAEQIASAISYVLTTEGWTYTSGGNITVRLVDKPVSSRWPVDPNIPVNGFTGAVLGLLIGFGYVVWQAERLRARHQPE